MTQGSAGDEGKGSEAGRKAVRVSLTFQDFRSFITQYDSHISMGGMFIGTRSPLSPGTSCKLDVKLKDGYQLIQGLGEVAWTRDRAQGPDRPPGMGVRFRELEESSRDLIFEIVDRRLVEGSGVFQLDRAGEPQPQDIPDLEEILRRAERRREEAREEEMRQVQGLSDEESSEHDTSSSQQEAELSQEDSEADELPDDEAWPALANGGDEDEDAVDSGSGEIVAQEIAPELATGVLFGEGLDWLKEGFVDAQAEEAGEGSETGPQTSEQALQDLDELLRETAPPEGPTTGEVEILTATDDLLSDSRSAPDSRVGLGAVLGAQETLHPGFSASQSPANRPPAPKPSATGAPPPALSRGQGSSSTPASLQTSFFAEPGAGAEHQQGVDDFDSPDLGGLLAGSSGQPPLPSEVLAARGDGPDEDSLLDDRTVTVASLGDTNRLPIDDLVDEKPAVLGGHGPPPQDWTPDAGASPAGASPAGAPPGVDPEPTDPGPAAEPTFVPESSYYFGDRKPSRRPFLFILLGLLAVAAAAFFYLQGGFGSKAGDGAPAKAPAASATAAKPEVVQVPVEDAASDANVPRAGEGSAAGAGQETVAVQPTGAATPALPDGLSSETGRDDAGQDDASQDGTSQAGARAAAAVPSLDPMRSVTAIAARSVPEGTLITITTDGAVEAGRYRYALIGSGSPRLLVRLFGVEKGAHRDTVSVATPEVGKIRTGYHAGNSGQELHIVLDLATSAVVVDRVEARGNELLIWAEGSSR